MTESSDVYGPNGVDPDADAGLAPASPEYPPLVRQAMSFGKAVVAHVASGLAKVDDAELARRMAICEACPEFIPEDRRCVLCGCAMKLKARWRSEACPLGKWGDPRQDDGGA